MVKIKEVQKSDEELSSEQEEYPDEEGEFESGEDELMMEEGESELDEESGEEEVQQYIQNLLAVDNSDGESIEDEEEAIKEILKSKKEMKKIEQDLKKKIVAKEEKMVLKEPTKTKKAKVAEAAEEDKESINQESYDSDKEIAAYDEMQDDVENMTEAEFQKAKFKKFGQREVNDVAEIKTRLHEVKQNFYNRLESKKLIKKYGRIPFTEHMSVTNEKPVEIAEGAKALQINDDIKREMTFYNLTREDVMKGMQILIQTKVPLSRPDDYLAEMLKTDVHMQKVKSNLLKQQHKIQKFEEKKSKQENKKFHKAIKNFTQQKRHQEKKDNLNAITELKDKIKQSGGDIKDGEFEKIMLKTGSKEGMDPEKGKRTKERVTMIDKLKGANGKFQGKESAPPDYSQARRGEKGRIGQGRFNRTFAQEKQKILSGGEGKDADKKGGDRRGGNNQVDRKPGPNSGGFKNKGGKDKTPNWSKQEKSPGFSGGKKEKPGNKNKRARPGKNKRGKSSKGGRK